MTRYAGFFRVFLATVFVCLATAVPGRADTLQITGSNTIIASGTTGFVTFQISSTGTDLLQSFSLELNITAISASGVLTFSTDNLNDVIDPFNNSNYVFYNNSTDGSSPPNSVWGNTQNSGETINGSDSTFDGTNVTITSEGSYLLATVEVDAGSAVTGDTYAISLSTDGNTYFQDAAPDSDFIGFNDDSSSNAYVTIAPVPPSLMLAGIGSLSSLLYCWRNRRKAQPQIV